MRRALTASWLLPSFAASAQAGDGDRIREVSRDVLSQGLYTYDDESRMNFEWGWLVDPITRTWDQLIDYLDRLFASAPEGTQTFLYIVLSAVLLLLLAHLGYVIYRAVQPPVRIVADDNDVGTPALRPDELIARANALADQGNYVDASRALYEGALLMLEEKRRGHLRRGLTATEYLRTFQAPWVRDNLRTFVDLINWKWYRARNFDADDYAQCRTAYEVLAAKLQETA